MFLLQKHDSTYYILFSLYNSNYFFQLTVLLTRKIVRNPSILRAIENKNIDLLYIYNFVYIFLLQEPDVDAAILIFIVMYLIFKM